MLPTNKLSLELLDRLYQVRQEIFYVGKIFDISTMALQCMAAPLDAFIETVDSSADGEGDGTSADC